jgi:hypothetical protein
MGATVDLEYFFIGVWLDVLVILLRRISFFTTPPLSGQAANTDFLIICNTQPLSGTLKYFAQRARWIFAAQKFSANDKGHEKNTHPTLWASVKKLSALRGFISF